MLENDKVIETHGILVQNNAKRQLTIAKALQGDKVRLLNDYEKKLEESYKRQLAAQEKKDNVAVKKEKELQKQLNKAKRDVQKEFDNFVLVNSERIAKAAANRELSYYTSLSAAKKVEYNKELKAELNEQRNASLLRQKILSDEHALILQDESNLQSELSELTKKFNSEENVEKQAAIQEKISAVKQKIAEKAEEEARKKSEIESAKSEVKKSSDMIKEVEKRNKKIRSFNKLGTKEEVTKNLEDAKQHKREAVSHKESVAKNFVESQESYQKKLEELQKNTDKSKTKGLKKALKDEEKNIRATAKFKEAMAEAEMKVEEANSEKKQAMSDAFAKAVEEDLSRAGKAAMNVMNKVGGSIDSNLDAMFGSQGKMMGRLQGLRDATGSMFDWADAVSDVSDTIGFSGVVSKKNVVAKMVELVDSGVAYNIELRAFLAETSENIAATFDATNGTLLRLIRIQQADSTAARLGMEASLTKLFNSYFQDTSYLANNVSESVSAAILDASAVMSKENSLAFEYTLQKWLGALYSIGLSEETVSSIATGINYLGTGNVSALSGNTQLQSLLTMAASKSGFSYDEILTNGLSAENTNDLLKGIVELLTDINNSQNNLVTKSAYADLFGMSLTDLRTFSSLTSDEITNLYNTTASYQSLVKETESQLTQIQNRISLSSLVDTAIDNALVGTAEAIGSNAFTYGTWKALGVLTDYVGEIKIPSVLAAGFGLSSDIDLLNVAKTGMVGFGLIGSLIGALSGSSNGGPTLLSNWNFSENSTTQRGNTLSVINSGVTQNTSYSAKLGVGSASGSDVEAVSTESAQDKAYESSGVSSEEVQEGKDITKNIYNALAGDDTPNILAILQEIDTRLDPSRVFFTSNLGAVEYSREITNILAMLQDVDARLNPSRVFFTSNLGAFEEGTDITKNIYNDFAGEDTLNILAVLQDIDTRLAPSRLFLTSNLGEVEEDTPEKILSEFSGVTFEEAEENDDITNILAVLQDIDTRLDPSRVFFTSSLGTVQEDAAEKILSESAELLSYSILSKYDTSLSEKVSNTFREMETARSVTESSVTQEKKASESSSSLLSSVSTENILTDGQRSNSVSFKNGTMISSNDSDEKLKQLIASAVSEAIASYFNENSIKTNVTDMSHTVSSMFTYNLL